MSIIKKIVMGSAVACAAAFTPTAAVADEPPPTVVTPTTYLTFPKIGSTAQNAKGNGVVMGSKFANTDRLSVSFLIKNPKPEMLAASGAYNGVIVSTGALGNDTGMMCMIKDTNGSWKFVFQVRSSGGIAQASSAEVSVADGEWHHVVVTYDKSAQAMKIYVDGVSLAVTYYDNPQWVTCTHTYPLTIGRHSYNKFDYNYAGSVADVAYFNKALTPVEVGAQLSGLTGSETGLVGWWPMDEGEGTTVHDAKGSNNGTIRTKTDAATDQYWTNEGPKMVAALAAQEAALTAKLLDVLEQCAAQYRELDRAASPLGRDEKGGLRVPHGYDVKTRKLYMQSVRCWTAGHYPGSLWYLYEATGDSFFRDRATEWTEILAPNAEVDDNHDVGFIMNCSFGNARRLLKTDKYDALLVQTADSLSRRFNAELGLIRSWGAKSEKKNFLVIPDNMMNLELLELAAKAKGGDARFDRIARSHADKTMANHFRSDGGCYHVLDYDQRPGFVGTVQNIQRGQGLSCGTAWSRGQAWGIYGYTMMYRETGESRYLAFAKKLADFAMNHPNMPADGVPYWDFGAPGEERDSSAGAIMASALLELETLDPESRGRYRAFAVKQLLTLCTPEYLSKGDEIGHFLLKHGVGHKPGRSEVDTPLNYGDYYFLEALVRFRARRAKKTD